MKKHTSLRYLLLHLCLFILGIVMIYSGYHVYDYVEHYNKNYETYLDTPEFHRRYMKYIERLTLYIHYVENGYTTDESSLADLDDILKLENDYNDASYKLSDEDEQENFEFYNYVLNVQSTNFIYCVQNTVNGKTYYSPYWEMLYPKDIKQFSKSIEDNPAYFVINTKSGKYTTNANKNYDILNKGDLSWIIESLSEPIYNMNKANWEEYNYIIYTAILPDFSNIEDAFYSDYVYFTQKRNSYNICRHIFPTSGLLTLIFFIILLFQTGHHKVNIKESETTRTIYLNSFDHIMSEIACGIILAMLVVVFLIIRMCFTDYNFNYNTLLIFIYSMYTVLYPISMGGILSLTRRIKAGTLWKNSLIYRTSRFLLRKSREFFAHHNITYRISAVLLIFLGIQLFGVFLYLYIQSKLLLILLIFVSYLFLVGYFLRFAIDLGVIMDGTQKIQDGNINQKLPCDSLTPALKPLCEQINNISSGLWVAVEERTKSERFKAELITNVSHDIKTPLTSIINYVDLMKKQPIEDEKAKEYLDILTNKSWRLKTLIEDLVEASKASSGAIKMNPQKLDLVELIKQAAGEFDDRFHENSLEPVITTPDQNVTIYADGRSTYRVIDNLLSNVNKYALHGTRVYIDVYYVNNFAALSVKNISKTRLNITPDELMERFVRGDSSRNTEGSGLGLSISRSLTSLQNGTFDIEVDGDLFKVIVRLPLYREPENLEALPLD